MDVLLNLTVVSASAMGHPVYRIVVMLHTSVLVAVLARDILAANGPAFL